MTKETWHGVLIKRDALHRSIISKETYENVAYREKRPTKTSHIELLRPRLALLYIDMFAYLEICLYLLSRWPIKTPVGCVFSQLVTKELVTKELGNDTSNGGMRGQ
jgi:hypothetical protein